ncbi:hypothetical protein NPS01_00250 [Nocardioides psychrotolerans]|uniref:Diguanylate cyclase (GGDEF) domain-containing protein n=1 Tax=Nocardioides psychrotolerans TaxID=1005945 RepID=A0A1I3BZL3_9ACTN|nr:bifunctional diguanylate cyclase/phosphodiesterase [Nocardioides psychrotolerans]GEP36362.1 hypothetical protein NPS01_00250 [Nocardioides psychrotolerans]SFH67724.1 diguanylate cyclase (GGDEF) domain-containing protein [Nocardioides psychrotolerans]
MTWLPARLRARDRRAVDALPVPDHLTGLPRRGHLLDAGQRLLAAVHDDPADTGVLAVLVVDVDHLKQVNDALGHEAGDRVLVEAARRLRALPGRPTVARLGGDEFGVLQRCSDPATAESVAAQARRALARPVPLGDGEVPGGASVGLAVSGRDGTTLVALLSAADQAMYSDKRLRRGHRRTAPRAAVAPDHDLADDLRRALDDPLTRGLRLRLHHQPQVDAGGRIVGFEALLRWAHPGLGLLAPADFLPLAERVGLLGALDDVALHQALRDHRVLDAHCPGVRQSVNLSARSLLSPDLAGRLAGLLDLTGVPGHRLVLEVSESATGLPVTSSRHDALVAVGCTLSVQEFGSAHASLTSLSDNPLVREVKLPPALVVRVGHDASATRLARGLVNAAHGLELRVVAAGVETSLGARRLLELGCDALQGYGVAPPMSLLEVTDWVDYWQRVHPEHPAYALPA